MKLFKWVRGLFMANDVPMTVVLRSDSDWGIIPNHLLARRLLYTKCYK